MRGDHLIPNCAALIRGYPYWTPPEFGEEGIVWTRATLPFDYAQGTLRLRSGNASTALREQRNYLFSRGLRVKPAMTGCSRGRGGKKQRLRRCFFPPLFSRKRPSFRPQGEISLKIRYMYRSEKSLPPSKLTLSLFLTYREVSTFNFQLSIYFIIFNSLPFNHLAIHPSQ